MIENENICPKCKEKQMPITEGKSIIASACQSCGYVLELRDPNTERLKNDIMQQIVGLNMAISTYRRYTTNPAPIIDELKAIKEDLLQKYKKL